MMAVRQTHSAGEWTLFGRTRRICVRKIHRIGPRLQACLISTLLIAPIWPGALADELSVTPATMARIGTVDERFQSYNVEMVEVTGGRFWRPYRPNASDAHSDLYEYRPPIDLTRLTHGCEGWLQHWRLPICVSAELGPTPPILQIRIPRHPRRPPDDSTEF